MLGSRAEAEDVVGDVAERWTAADRATIREPEGWLVTVTTRRALDVLRSARVQREEYPGTWLPEPIATDGDPDMDVERLESLTMGFLVLLERLTPIERAVFVLHDALDHPYELVAEAVGRSEDACRQALSRARKHVTVPARRTPAERQQAEEVADPLPDRRHRRRRRRPARRAVARRRRDERRRRRRPRRDPPVVGAAPRRPLPAQPRQPPRRRPARRAVRDQRQPGRSSSTSPTGWSALSIETDGDVVTAVHVIANPAKLERLVAVAGTGRGRPPGVWEAARPFRHRHGQADLAERSPEVDTR